MLNCGDTFLTRDGEGEDFHLWIVITPPSEGEVVTVSLTTRRKNSETIVVLRKGDHPFIEHESVIAYSYSKIRMVVILRMRSRTVPQSNASPCRTTF